jgi:hypothetical protein
LIAFVLTIVFSPCFKVATTDPSILNSQESSFIPMPKPTDPYNFQTCCLCRDWQFVLLALFAFYYVGFIVFCWVLRDIRQSFNEYRETRVIGVLALSAYALSVAIIFTDLSNTCAGRSALTLVCQVVASSPLWFVVAPILFDRFTRKQEAEQEFRKNLQAEAQEAAMQGVVRGSKHEDFLANQATDGTTNSGATRCVSNAESQVQ